MDFGTNSVRAVVVDVTNGDEVGTAVSLYPSGDQGVLLDRDNHHLARQNPTDYINGLEVSIIDALKDAADRTNMTPSQVIGIGVDTTGSTPIPVDGKNRPLALDRKWEKNLAAHAWLWKDHTSAIEAQKITEMANGKRPQYLKKYGGTYSSEWFWSKIWHCLRTAPDVFDAAQSWVELSDFIPALLSGIDDPMKIRRGICAAGHKAIYNEEWGGLPDREFLALLDPKLADLRDRLYERAHAGDTPAGFLSGDWADRLGLNKGISIAMGAFDAHLGAVGAGVGEGVLVKIIGTSTCDITVYPKSKGLTDIPGICGIADDSVLPGFYGIEAGQSAVGDIFKWFVERLLTGGDELYQSLEEEASVLKPGESGLLALDWNNGNRTILVDPLLTGLLIGQTLYTTPAEIYRALIEATAFGARTIIERLEESGVEISRIVCIGGIPEKSPLLMQIYADVTGRVIEMAKSSETCALGSAVSAAVVAGKKAGGYDDYEEAQRNMTSIKEKEYRPDSENGAVYDELFNLYMELHDGFGGISHAAGQGKIDYSHTMKRLIGIKESVKENI